MSVRESQTWVGLEGLKQFKEKLAAFAAAAWKNDDQLSEKEYEERVELTRQARAEIEDPAGPLLLGYLRAEIWRGRTAEEYGRQTYLPFNQPGKDPAYVAWVGERFIEFGTFKSLVDFLQDALPLVQRILDGKPNGLWFEIRKIGEKPGRFTHLDVQDRQIHLRNDIFPHAGTCIRAQPADPKLPGLAPMQAGELLDAVEFAWGTAWTVEQKKKWAADKMEIWTGWRPSMLEEK